MFFSPWCPHAAGSQNILLSTLSAWQDALNLLQNTKGMGIQSDAITFNSIMAYHGRLSESLVACVVGKITSWTLSASTSIPWFEFTTIMRMCFFRRGKTIVDQKFKRTTTVVPFNPTHIYYYCTITFPPTYCGWLRNPAPVDAHLIP